MREPVADLVELLVLTTLSFFDEPELFDKSPPLNKCVRQSTNTKLPLSSCLLRFTPSFIAMEW